MSMKKVIALTSVAAVLCGAVVGGVCGANALGARAAGDAEEPVYSTSNNITEQGQNNFYYAWGTPDHYVLMEYGLGSSGSKTWHGLELYQSMEGASMHPGNFWGVMAIWVAEESGTVALDGYMEKGTKQGDGVHLGVYRYSDHEKAQTILHEFVRGTEEKLRFDVSEEVEVRKGDCLVFYCDSGKAKANASDSCGCPFTIKYLTRAGDKAANEDMTQYLNAGRAGDIGGFKHIDVPFGAEILDGRFTVPPKEEN